MKYWNKKPGDSYNDVYQYQFAIWYPNAEPINHKNECIPINHQSTGVSVGVSSWKKFVWEIGIKYTKTVFGIEKYTYETL